MEDEKLTVDGNHPLTGKTAKFVIKVLEVRDATAIEINENISNPNASVH